MLRFCLFLQDEEMNTLTDVDKLLTRLKEVQNELIDKSKTFEEYNEDLRKASMQMNIKRQSLDAFEEAVKMFKDQMKAHEKFQKDAQPHEINR